MGDEGEGSFGVVETVLDALVEDVAERVEVAGGAGGGDEVVVVGGGGIVREGLRDGEGCCCETAKGGEEN